MSSDLEAMLVELLEQGRHATAADLLRLSRDAARHLGVDVASLYLVDMEQRLLQPMPGSVGTDAPAVDTTLPGRAYRAVETIVSGENGSYRAFVPVLDGATRIGVLDVRLGTDDADLVRTCELLATLIGGMLLGKQPYDDVVARTRRRKDMRLAAEIQWMLLPPLTLQTPSVTISGILEPSYEIGGDAFDYAANGERAHLLLVDAMGHGLDSSLIASLVVGAYRHCRRGGAGLVETYVAIDDVVAKRFGPDRFATAQLAELDLTGGTLRWINAGHPAPVLVREGRVVGWLEREPVLPFGLGDDDIEVTERQLQPGDAVLWFTDGVVEARSPTGDFFGEERLVDLLTKALHSGEPIPEVLRRLTHAVLDHHDGSLRDDATMLFLAWNGAPEG